MAAKLITLKYDNVKGLNTFELVHYLERIRITNKDHHLEIGVGSTSSKIEQTIHVRFSKGYTNYYHDELGHYIELTVTPAEIDKYDKAISEFIEYFRNTGEYMEFKH